MRKWDYKDKKRISKNRTLSEKCRKKTYMVRVIVSGGGHTAADSAAWSWVAHAVVSVLSHQLFWDGHSWTWVYIYLLLLLLLLWVRFLLVMDWGWRHLLTLDWVVSILIRASHDHLLCSLVNLTLTDNFLILLQLLLGTAHGGLICFQHLLLLWGCFEVFALTTTRCPIQLRLKRLSLLNDLEESSGDVIKFKMGASHGASVLLVVLFLCIDALVVGKVDVVTVLWNFILGHSSCSQSRSSIFRLLLLSKQSRKSPLWPWSLIISFGMRILLLLRGGNLLMSLVVALLILSHNCLYIRLIWLNLNLILAE